MMFEDIYNRIGDKIDYKTTLIIGPIFTFYMPKKGSRYYQWFYLDDEIIGDFKFSSV